MKQVGVFDLKTRLSEMIGRVQAGEEFLVTNRGKPVALLTFPDRSKKEQEKKFFKDLQILLCNAPLADSVEELKNMIEEGRM